MHEIKTQKKRLLNRLVNPTKLYLFPHFLQSVFTSIIIKTYDPNSKSPDRHRADL